MNEEPFIAGGSASGLDDVTPPVEQRCLSASLAAELPCSGNHRRVTVVLGVEAVVRVAEVHGFLLVALQALLLDLWAVVHRVGVHLLDVPLDGADLQGGQGRSAHHADESVPAAVVVHQVLQPPADLVVPPLVFAGVVALAPGRGSSTTVLGSSSSTRPATPFPLHQFAGFSINQENVLGGFPGTVRVSLCSQFL